MFVSLNNIYKEILQGSFFGSGRDLNPEPFIFYALFQPTELSSKL